MASVTTAAAKEPRDSIKDVHGPRTPYKHEWPTRVDEQVIEEPERWVQSACVLCSNGCGMDIGVKNGKVVGVRGRVTDRVNKGRLGPKGLNAWTGIHHKDRLQHPMIRKNGKLERATWDEAMSLIVRKAQETRERLTAHGIAFYTSGQLFLEEYYALAMVGKAGLNTLHMDGNTRLCTATAAASMRESFGSDGQPGSYTDIDYTDCIFMVGHNMAATQTVLWARILDRLAGPHPPKLIVVDPRKSESAKHATVHLAPRIGTNLALLNGIQHLLFQNGWVDDDFVSQHCIGVDELKEKVSSYTPERTLEITNVPIADVEEAAKIIGESPTLLSTALQGVYQSNQATASACQVNNINLLKGAIGRPGSGIYQMNGQPTAQNNREAGCDGEFPGFRNPQNERHMRELAEIWNIDYEKIPHWQEPTHVQNILSYIANGSIEMLWISGTNPLVSLPNLPRVRELFTKAELFIVAQDIFPTETTAIADVVLPAAQWGEKTGCFTNVDRTVHLSHKAVEPPGEARSDFDIFVDFARRMDFRDRDGQPLMPWNKEEDGFKAWKRQSIGRPCDYSELSYDKLTGGSGVQWPCTKEYPNGKERLYDDRKFYTHVDDCESFGHDLETGTPISKAEFESMNPAGRAILKSCHYIPDPEECNNEYPLQLSTGRNVYHFHTRSKTGRSKPLQDAAPEPLIHISEEDAGELGIKTDDEVLVRSRRGEAQMKAFVGKTSKGQTFIPFHFGYFDAGDDRARAANELTTDRWDPVSKQPCFKAGAIRIEKCESKQEKESSGEVKIHVKSQQGTAIEMAATNKPDAEKVTNSAERQRHIAHWLGATCQSVRVLHEALGNRLPEVVADQEIRGGFRILEYIAKVTMDVLEPFRSKYHTDSKYGHEISASLRDNLFTRPNSKSSPYEALVTLTGLHTFMAFTEAHLSSLVPVTQALCDPDFTAAIKHAEANVSRMMKWVKQQLSVRTAQTLVVPGLNIIQDDEKWVE